MQTPNAGLTSAVCFAVGLLFLVAAKPILAVIPDVALLAAILACFALSVVSGIFAAIKGRRWAVFFPVAVLVVLGFVLNPFYWKDRVPVIDWAVRLHSERGSVDCGRTSNRDDATVTPQQALQCVHSAAASHKPYFVRSTAYGVDVKFSTAIVADSDGRAIELMYATGMEQPYKLTKHRCSTPAEIRTDDFGLHCVPWLPDKWERDFIVL